MYKKDIIKRGKKIGPYYYESVRDKNGKVKTIYLGRNPKKVALPSIGFKQFYLKDFFGLVVYRPTTILDENINLGANRILTQNSN